MRARTAAAGVVVAVVAALAPGRARADDAEKAIRDAFRPLRLPPAAKVEKEAVPLLPGGIVTQAGPFDAAVRKLLEPYAAQLDERDRAAAGGAGTAAAAAALVAGLRTLEAETAELAARVAAVEERYGEVFDAEWSAASEKTRETRKLAAVLIPLYRTLAFRNAAAAATAGASLAGAKDAPRTAWLAATAAGDASPAARSAALAALARIGGGEALAAVSKACASDAVPSVRTAALVALLSWRTSDVRDALVAALGDAAWEVRALAAAACVRGQVVDAVEPMVRALEKEDGRLRHDLDDALHALTGQRYYGDAALWRKWLAGHRAELDEKARALAAAGTYDRPIGAPGTWDAPADGAGVPPTADDPSKDRGATSSFYGIDTPSRRVLFVVDVSLSMEQPAKDVPAATTGTPKDPYPAPAGRSKLDVTKWQLHRAVHALPRDAAFDVLVYSESYKAWQGRMTEATPAAKAKAHAFVDALRPNGTTNVCDALDAAFETAGAGPLATPAKGARPGLAADTVYLLSDGDPNRGRLSDTDALLASVVERVRTARIVVHAIGIGDVAGSPFLQALAARTGGRYVGFR